MFSIFSARQEIARQSPAATRIDSRPLYRLLTLCCLVAALPLALANVSESPRQERLATYTDKVATLRSEAIRNGSVCYTDVIQTVYADFDLQSILAAKSDWRLARGSGSTFLTDYESLAASASVAEVKPVRNPQLGSTMIGRYEPRVHAIKIADTASDFAIVHEAGHALQRRALSDRSIHRSKSVRFTELELNLRSYSKRPGIDPIDAKRLRYLASQDEFEVRLQDLNRFYAITGAGRPIMDPADAIDALARLGLDLEPEIVRWALQGIEQFDGERIEAILEHAHSEPVSADISRYFDDAYELRMLQKLSQKIDGDLWRNLLRKIILEAPGHI